jgi:hypothetical protein
MELCIFQSIVPLIPSLDHLESECLVAYRRDSFVYLASRASGLACQNYLAQSSTAGAGPMYCYANNFVRGSLSPGQPIFLFHLINSLTTGFLRLVPLGATARFSGCDSGAGVCLGWTVPLALEPGRMVPSNGTVRTTACRWG